MDSVRDVYETVFVPGNSFIKLIGMDGIQTYQKRKETQAPPTSSTRKHKRKETEKRQS